MKKENIAKAVAYILTAIATAIGIAFGLSSCQVSRIVTTSAESHQKGDTTLIIQTKTIETYTGTKKSTNI